MTKINTGGVKIKITKSPGQDTTIKINLSIVGRHVTGPFKIWIPDGEKYYRVTVEEMTEGKKDE